MSKIIFFSLPSHGHLNPSLVLIKELVRKGHTIECFATKEFKEGIIATGATYREYPKYKDIDIRIAKHWVLAIYEMLGITKYLSEIMLPIVKAKKPDCIMHDSLAVWGKTLASKLNIPAVCLTTTFAFNKKMWQLHPKSIVVQHLKFLRFPKKGIKIFSLYKHIATTYHLVDGFYDLFTNKEGLNLVYTSSYFQPYANSFDTSFKFIGPAVAGREGEEAFVKALPKNKPIVYVSLGTIYNDDLSFFKLCLQVFKNSQYTVVIALGHRFSASQLESIPKNIYVKNYVPQLNILAKASLFITHAGMNSVNESLYFGVPMILIPQMDEQTMNAIRVKQLGAGILLKKSRLSKKILTSAVNDVMSNNRYKKNALKIKETLTAAGGSKKGAEEIEKYIAKQT